MTPVQDEQTGPTKFQSNAVSSSVNTKFDHGTLARSRNRSDRRATISAIIKQSSQGAGEGIVMIAVSKQQSSVDSRAR